MYRVEMPGPRITNDIAADAKVRLHLARSQFNELAADGRARHWRAAFERGDAKVSGVDEIIRRLVRINERNGA